MKENITKNQSKIILKWYDFCLLFFRIRGGGDKIKQ